MCDFGKTVVYFFLLQVRELYVIYSRTQAVKTVSREKKPQTISYVFSWSVFTLTFNL